MEEAGAWSSGDGLEEGRSNSDDSEGEAEGRGDRDGDQKGWHSAAGKGVQGRKRGRSSRGQEDGDWQSKRFASGCSPRSVDDRSSGNRRSENERSEDKGSEDDASLLANRCSDATIDSGMAHPHVDAPAALPPISCLGSHDPPHRPSTALPKPPATTARGSNQPGLLWSSAFPDGDPSAEGKAWVSKDRKSGG